MASEGTTKGTGTRRLGDAGLRPADAYLLSEWAQALRAEGWSPSSVERDLRRLRALDRASTHGLCDADRADVVRFASRRGQAAGLAVEAMIRTEGWRQDVRAIRRFFQWTKTQYTGVASDPTLGLRLPPSHTRGPRIRARDGHLYERVLVAPELSVRDRAIVWLLAHGLTPAEVAALHIRSVDFGSNEVVVGSRAPRFVPLTETAAGYVAQWLLARGASEGESMFLGITPSAIGAIVHRAAAAVFHQPSQATARRRIHPLGFRHLFLQRLIRARVAADSIRPMSGVDRLSRLSAYSWQRQSRDFVRSEFERMIRQWPHWIQPQAD